MSLNDVEMAVFLRKTFEIRSAANKVLTGKNLPDF